MHHIERGSGRKLLLIHGLGGSLQSWNPILGRLAAERHVVAIDLPGHGATPAQPRSDSFAGLVEQVEGHIAEHRLEGVDMVGSSMGARIVLELARRGGVGTVVALDPGGFWQGWERSFFRTTIGLSGRLVRTIRHAIPAFSRSAASRTALLAQLSARPWALDPKLVEIELTGLADTATFDALVRDLATGPAQTGPAADPGKRIVIGWGKQDRLCLPRQAARAKAAFPSAELHWFDNCGHFPMWDAPAQTADLVLAATGE